MATSARYHPEHLIERGKISEIDKLLAEPNELQAIERLDRDTIDPLIGNFLVYSEQRIEIVFADKY